MLLLNLEICLAQNEITQKPPFEEQFKTSFRTKPKLDVKLDNRFSFIQDNDVRTLGVKVGLSFNRKFKLGVGYNWMVNSVGYDFQDEAIAGPVNLEYFYYSPYVEYTFYNSRRWEFSLATQLGFGEASYQFTNTDGVDIKLEESLMLSYEPAMLIDYKIIRWFGIGTGVGYRLIYYQSEGVNENYSSPEYVVKIKVYLGEIVRTFTGKEWQIDD